MDGESTTETMPVAVPLVRCRLDDDTGAADAQRYVPLSEFDLWRHLMESRHGRLVTIEQVSVWLPEDPGLWSTGLLPDELEPVVRLRLHWPGPYEVATPVERFFPAETFPRARAALLSHLPPGARLDEPQITAGYFVPERVWQAREERRSALA